jgi:hypothetical protein
MEDREDFMNNIIGNPSEDGRVDHMTRYEFLLKHLGYDNLRTSGTPTTTTVILNDHDADIWLTNVLKPCCEVYRVCGFNVKVVLQ